MLKYFYTYILLCADYSYYTGITNDIERRINEHNSEEFSNSYCYTRRPVKLMFAELFLQPEPAIEFEKQIKGWTRKKKEALIERNYEKLHELAKCKNLTSHVYYKKDASDSEKKSV
jgi:putative endonuclease